MECKCMNLLTIVERNHEIDATDLDEDKVMMDLNRGQYFMLNGVGGTIWDLIEAPISVAVIVERLLEEYDVAYAECETQVREFLHQMHHENLVRIHA